MKCTALRLIVAASVALSGCTYDRTIDGVTYEPYGLLSPTKESPDIVYELDWSNIVIACIFAETVIVPLYVFGFAIWQPVGKKGKRA